MIKQHIPIRYSTSEQRRMIMQYRKTGNISIRNKIVVSYIPFVKAIAKRYPVTDSLEMDDNIINGTLGIINAIEHYNPKYAFSTIATYYVKQQIYTSMHTEDCMIRIPQNKKITDYQNLQPTILDSFDLKKCGVSLPKEYNFTKDIIKDVINSINLTTKQKAYINDRFNDMLFIEIALKHNCSKQNIQQEISFSVAKIQKEINKTKL